LERAVAARALTMSVVFMLLTVGFVCWEVECEVVVEEMLR
jgi:hypothetical protein